ncbi:hypothetical protein [Aliiglaciecola aliphaticivorans]
MNAINNDSQNKKGRGKTASRLDVYLGIQLSVIRIWPQAFMGL